MQSDCKQKKGQKQQNRQHNQSFHDILEIVACVFLQLKKNTKGAKQILM